MSYKCYINSIKIHSSIVKEWCLPYNRFSPPSFLDEILSKMSCFLVLKATYGAEFNICLMNQIDRLSDNRFIIYYMWFTMYHLLFQVKICVLTYFIFTIFLWEIAILISYMSKQGTERKKSKITQGASVWFKPSLATGAWALNYYAVVCLTVYIMC